MAGACDLDAPLRRFTTALFVAAAVSCLRPALAAGDPAQQSTEAKVIASPGYKGDDARVCVPALAIIGAMHGNTSVTFAVHITAAGEVSTVMVTRSSGIPNIDYFATDCVRHFRYEPAKLGDQPVESDGQVTLSWDTTKEPWQVGVSEH
jgi:protein TonB